MNRQKSFENEKPTLYLVPTPIGNLSEMTPRAIEVLNSVDVIACEDTRTSGQMLKHFGISKRLIAYQNFNEDSSARGILNLLQQGNHWHTSVKLLAELFHSSYIKRPANPHAKATAAMQIHNPMPRRALFTVGIVVPIEQPPLAGATLRRLRQYRRICPAM